MLQFRNVGVAVLAWILWPPLCDGSDVAWRGFTSADGLRESYCSKLSVGPTGRVLIIHGHTDRMSVMDGYGVRQLPVPGVEVKAKEGPTGEIWAFAPEGVIPNPADLDERQKLIGLQRYSEASGKWEVFEIPEIRSTGLESPDPFIPVARAKVLYLLRDRLMEFDADSRHSRELWSARATTLGEFLDLQPSASGGFWVGGRRGLGRFDPGSGAPWKEYPLGAGGALGDVSGIREQRPGAVSAVARDAARSLNVLLRLRRGAWESVAESRDTICGWEADDGVYWIVEGAPEHFSVVRKDGYGSQVEERIKPLSGTFRQAVPAQGGTFWLATNISAVRHAPLAWGTPPQFAVIDGPVASMAEDRQGRLYFVSYDRLYVLDGNNRAEFPYPAGMRADLYQQPGTCFLEDGRLAIATSRIALLTFDPATRTFKVVAHPQGQRVRSLGPRKGGGIWVALYQPDSAKYRLGYYDGLAFHDFLDLGEKWRINHLRAVAEPGDGSVWMGGAGADGLGVYRDGSYRTLTAADGYIAGGSYAILVNPDGSLWFGDRDGISEYDGKNWKPIRSGLETVRWLRRTRDGSVWVASGGGLHRYFMGSWVSVGVPEGLSDGGMFYIHQDSRDRIWACGTRGISLYCPEADRDPPQTLVPADQNIRQMPPQGEVRIEFTGIDRWNFTDTARLLYSHRLDGGTWSPFASETAALFRNVRAGGHVFEVRAMDRNWNIDASPEAFQFEVLLPWYRAPGFLALLAGAIFLVLLLAALHTRRHVRLGQLVLARTAELSSANEQLRSEITERERTALEKERLEEQYVQAQKMEAVGRLSGGLAHDFNNLLTVINGYSEMALEGGQSRGELEEYLREIRRAGQQAAGLTRQLLALSRKQILKPVVLDLNSVVREAAGMFKSALSEEVRLVFDLAPDLGMVRADRGQIGQALMNLVINARDAMPAGGTLAIETRNARNGDCAADATAGTGPCVCLVVRDTGVGMDQETQVRIFEPFFTTKEPGKGTGLGLSMVFGIVKQSGGSIRVESEPGKGSAFSIVLPRFDGIAPGTGSPAGTRRA